MLTENLDIKNLHHAYLVSGGTEYKQTVLNFLNNASIRTETNPDFYDLHFDIFRIEDARNLKALTEDKSFSGGKKIFIISANSILLEAQNAMLKIFEEPKEDTHFFVFVSDANNLLKTFTSRFYLIENVEKPKVNEAKNFIKMNLSERLEFVKNLVKAEEEESTTEISPRTRTLDFLNKLEQVLYESSKVKPSNLYLFEHILNTRKALRMPGSAPKMLLESIAIAIPE